MNNNLKSLIINKFLQIVHKALFSIFLIFATLNPVLAENKLMTQQSPDLKNTPIFSQTLWDKRLSVKPPKAEQIPFVVNVKGKETQDNYHWLRDTHWPKVEDPKILEFLKAENSYADAFIKDQQPQYDKLYKELTARIKLEDSSVPLKRDDYYYYHSTEKDSNYPIFARKYKSLTHAEEIILDVNQLAQASPYFSLGTLHISNDHRKLLYSVDTNGSDRYTVSVKDLSTGKTLSDRIENTLGPVYWNNEGTGFFYAKLSDSWRTEEVYFHQLGDPQSKDKLLYKEQDPLYMVHLDRSSNKRFLFIVAQSKDSSEVRFLDLNKGKLEPQLIEPRKNEHLYSVDQHGDLFYILTNDKGKNFRLVTTPISKPNQSHWQEWIAHKADVYLGNIALYEKYLVLSTREQGLSQIKIFNLKTKAEESIQFPDPTYDASHSFTGYEATGPRIIYSSLVTPESTLEYDFATKTLTTLKTAEIPSGYDKSLYHTERLFATSKDGSKIPISLVYKKSLFKKDGKNPLSLYGYGSYGSAVDPVFKHHLLSLIDRGFVYAIAHVRGGDEMGYEWYESAKFLNKKNTFNDFISVADYLIHEKYTSSGNLSITGRSAGGLLVGVSVNERPELFKTVIADVPFVDVLNTMLDETLPLTPGEFKEWGNPKDPQYYDYIKSYSPYDNVKAQAYPAMFVSAGINDPRVTYWEPAKWVAKLREMKTDDNLILLQTNMDAGHAGASGRFGVMKDVAKEYLFILLIHGLSI